MDFVPGIAASYAALLGLVSAVVTIVILAARRALEGRSGVDFADLGTAAAVGLAVALVPLIGWFVALRAIGRRQGWAGPDVYRVVDPMTPPHAQGTQSRPPSAGGAVRCDKFTPRARKVLTLAQDEAQRFNHNYIGTEHLLLGLVREGQGVAARVLVGMNIELEQIRTAVEFVIGRGDRPTVGEVGITPRAKRVIELAIDEARRLGHTYIGTEHLLLGLAREGEGIAAGVLESLGVNLDRVRHEVIRVLAESARKGDEGEASPA
jgi:ClpA/ClpB-like protein